MQMWNVAEDALRLQTHLNVFKWVIMGKMSPLSTQIYLMQTAADWETLGSRSYAILETWTLRKKNFKNRRSFTHKCVRIIYLEQKTSKCKMTTHSCSVRSVTKQLQIADRVWCVYCVQHCGDEWSDVQLSLSWGEFGRRTTCMLFHTNRYRVFDHKCIFQPAGLSRHTNRAQSVPLTLQVPHFRVFFRACISLA